MQFLLNTFEYISQSRLFIFACLLSEFLLKFLHTEVNLYIWNLGTPSRCNELLKYWKIMDIVVYLALAVLAAVFLFSLFILIVMCHRKHEYNRLFMAQSLRFSKLQQDNLEDVIQLGPHICKFCSFVIVILIKKLKCFFQRNSWTAINGSTKCREFYKIVLPFWSCVIY